MPYGPGRWQRNRRLQIEDLRKMRRPLDRSLRFSNLRFQINALRSRPWVGHTLVCMYAPGRDHCGTPGRDDLAEAPT
jgi:hypothetical protein